MQDSVGGINFQIDFFLILSFFLLFRGDLWKNHKIFSPAIDGSWPFTYTEVLILLHRRISITQPELSEIGYSRATPGGAQINDLQLSKINSLFEESRLKNCQRHTGKRNTVSSSNNQTTRLTIPSLTLRPEKKK